MNAKVSPIEWSNPSHASTECHESKNMPIHNVENRGRSSYCNPLSDEEQISRSAMHMYDIATWRMYHRIMTNRRNRAEYEQRRAENAQRRESYTSETHDSAKDEATVVTTNEHVQPPELTQPQLIQSNEFEEEEEVEDIFTLEM
jgi:hypothetical protein